MRWLQPNSMDEWHQLLRPVLYDGHRWPLPLMNIVIDYLYNERRLVIICHDKSGYTNIIWSLSSSIIHNLVTTSPAAMATTNDNKHNKSIRENENKDGHNDTSSSLSLSLSGNEWYKHVSMPTKVKGQWCIIDRDHHRIIHGNAYTLYPVNSRHT
jgi:hypothetical protein